MLFSIQILITKVLKNWFLVLVNAFCMRQLLNSFCLKKYLPELEKCILCISLNILCMWLFSQFLKCSEDSEIPNSIFYVCGLRYRSFFETELFFQWECWFFWLQVFWKTVLWLFSFEFTSFFGTELFFKWDCLFFLASGILKDGSMAFFVWIHKFFFGTELFFKWECLFFLASGILEDSAVAFFHLNLKVFQTELFFQWQL